MNEWSRLRLACTTLVLAPLVVCTANAQAPQRPASLAFTHVAVVDVAQGRILADQTVLVSGNRISTVGPSGRVHAPADAPVVDGRGKYLVPGLWDMHVHAVRQGRAPWMFPLFLRFGVTGLRDTGSPVDSLLFYRAAVLDGRVVGPRVVGAGPLLDGAGGAYPALSRFILSPDDGRHVVDSLADAGVNFIKTYNQLTRGEFLAIAAEARRRGIPLIGHVPWEMTAIEASDSGLTSIEHMTQEYQSCIPRSVHDSLNGVWAARHHDGMPLDSTAWLATELTRREIASFDPRLCATVGARLARNGTWQDPTLERDLRWGRRFLTSDTVAADPELRYVPASVRVLWRRWADSVKADPAAGTDHDLWYPLKASTLAGFHRAGDGLLAGTDTDGNDSNIYGIPGLALQRELEVFVRDVGLTPAEALRTATLNPARILHATDTLGTVAPGKLADLVLLDANPLADIRNLRRVAAVVANGRYLDRATLDAMLEDSRRRLEAAAGDTLTARDH